MYDVVFGASLDAGRLEAFGRLPLVPGNSVLEVGVGTGLSLSEYPATCHVTAIDVSSSMLDRARRRLAGLGVCHIKLMHMDAAAMGFPDASFDVVYAAYVMSTVQDPRRVLSEMQRVCRPGGCIVLLNHFRSRNRMMARLERLITPLTVHIGFRSDLGLDELLSGSNLELVSVEKVGRRRLWSLVVCRR